MWLVYICIGFSIFLGAASMWVQLQDRSRIDEIIEDWEKRKRN